MRTLRGIVLVTVVAASWLHDVGPATATTYSVSTEAEWRTAIAAADADSSGPHVIEITADFTMTTAGTPQYNNITDLTVHGNGHEVSGSAADTGFLESSSLSATTTVEDLTIRDFEKSGPGALLLLGFDVVDHVTFLDNHAWDGGALFTGSDVVVRHSTFSGNHADHQGGAIDGYGRTIEDSTFVENVAEQGCGAVIHRSSVRDDRLITRSHFERNVSRGGAAGIGGALCYTEGRLTDSEFVANHAEGNGGAVHSFDVEIERTTFTDNVSDASGGAVYGSHLGVDASTFAGNAAARGGAITIKGSAGFPPAALDIANSTFSANSSTSSGGAVSSNSVNSGLTRLRYVTFADNRSDSGGADLAVTDLDVYGSVFTDPIGASSCAIPGSVTSSYSYAMDSSCELDGTGDTENGADPELGPLGDNGGPTPTMAPALTSPLVDGIDLAACDPDLPVDQRGVDRPHLGGAAASLAGCDIGAVEVGDAPPPPPPPPAARPVAAAPQFTG